MANNNAIFDAAYSGFVGGTGDGRFNLDAVAGDYSPQAAAANAFATAVDALIPAGSPTVPQENLLQSICYGALSGRYSTQTSGWGPIAAAIVAQWTTTKANLL